MSTTALKAHTFVLSAEYGQNDNTFILRRTLNLEPTRFSARGRCAYCDRNKHEHACRSKTKVGSELKMSKI